MRKTVIGEAYMLPDLSNEADVAEMQAWEEWYSDYVPADEDPGEPVSDLYYPIIDSELDALRLVDEEHDLNQPKKKEKKKQT